MRMQLVLVMRITGDRAVLGTVVARSQRILRSMTSAITTNTIRPRDEAHGSGAPMALPQKSKVWQQ